MTFFIKTKFMAPYVLPIAKIPTSAPECVSDFVGALEGWWNSNWVELTLVRLTLVMFMSGITRKFSENPAPLA